MDHLEHWVYGSRPIPAKVREKPMKVLALGMGRSGTESLSKALAILGYYRVYHGFDMGNTKPPSWEAWVKLARRKWGTQGIAGGDTGISVADLDAILGDCEAVTGSQTAMLAQEVIKAYPEAKVILNVRASDKWYQSASSTFGLIMSGYEYFLLPYFHSQLYWRQRYYQEMLQEYFHGSFADNGKWVYEEHCAKIRGLVPCDQLLEWQVEDGWVPLCRFLEKEHPLQDFPNGNKPEQMIESIGTLYVNEWSRAARYNLCYFVTGCVGILMTLFVYCQ